MTLLKRFHLAFGPILFLGQTACSDEPGPTPPAEAEGPRYAIGSSVFNADFTSQDFFVTFADELDGGEIDLEGAIPFSGGGTLWGVAGAAEFYVVGAERQTVSKFGFEDGVPVPLGEVGLGGEGVRTLLGEAMVFDGPDRAYLVDPLSAQAIELDLAAMEVVRSIDISSWLDSTQDTFVGFPPVLPRDDEVVLFTHANDFVADTVSLEPSKLVFFDPSNGAFETVDAPCAGLRYATTLDNGDLLFSADPRVASIWAIDDTRSPAPCMVRLAAGSRTPEVEAVDLTSIAGGRPAGGLVPTGDDGLYLRVLDTDQFPLDAGFTARELFGLPAWETWQINLASPNEAAPVDRPLLPGGITFFDVDGTIYESVATPDFASSTLF
ncbi:MAG: hypothetical protein AAGA48_35610, partial [Myxococcota bacterium]